jgi:hypothetical protein
MIWSLDLIVGRLQDDLLLRQIVHSLVGPVLDDLLGISVTDPREGLNSSAKAVLRCNNSLFSGAGAASAGAGFASDFAGGCVLVWARTRDDPTTPKVKRKVIRPVIHRSMKSPPFPTSLVGRKVGC